MFNDQQGQNNARWIAKELAELRRLQQSGHIASRLPYSSVPSGDLVVTDADGNAIDVVGNPNENTPLVPGPNPSKPSTPSVTAYLGTITATWDGTYTEDYVAPDLLRVEVHSSTDDDFEVSSGTLTGTISGQFGGSVTVAVEYGTHYVRFIAVSTSGSRSEPSDIASVEVTPLVETIEMQEVLDDLNARFDGIILEAGDLPNRLEQLALDLAAHNTRLQDAEAELELLNAQELTQLVSDLADAQTQIEQALTEVQTVLTDLERTQTELDALKNTTIPALETQINSTKTRLTSAETGISQSKTRLTEAEADLEEAFGQISTVDSKAGLARTMASDAQTTADEANTFAQQQVALLVARGQNLVRNGDFEAGDVGWNNSNNSSVKTVNARSGSKSLNITAPQVNTWPTSEWVPSSPGRTYYVEYYVREGGTPDDSGSVGAVAQVKTSAGGTASHTFAVTPTSSIPNFVFTKISGTITPGTSDIVAIRFAPWVSGPTTSSYDIDDFLAVDVTEAQAALSAAATAQSRADSAHTAAGTAQSTADNALTMAGSKNKVFYSTSNPSGTASLGDTWRKVNASNDVIAEWRWTAGNTWLTQQITSEVISNLDVGKLTAGSAIINTAVVNKIAIQTADVIKLNASAITAGTISASRIDVTDLAVRIATVIKLNADTITAGTISTGRLDATEVAAAVANVIQLNASKIVSGTVNTDRLNAGEIATKVATVIQLNASRITAGVINTDRLNVNEIAAKSAAFQTVDVRNLFVTTGSMSEAVINKLWTDVVHARKITTEMLAVSDFTNRIPTGLDGDNKAIDWATGLTPDFTNTPPGLEHSFKSDVGQSTKSTSSNVFDVAPEDEYVFEVWVRASKANSKIFFELRDQNGGHGVTSAKLTDTSLFWGNASYPVAGATVPTTWTKWQAKVTPKAGVRQLRIGSIYFNHSTGTTTDAQIWVAGLAVKKRFGGELVVDGAITAEKIKANAVESDKIKANAITADKIEVGAIEAQHIKAREITADKLRIGQGSNVFPDPLMKDIAGWNMVSTFNTYTGGYGSSNRVRVTAGTGQTGGYYGNGADNVRRFPVIPGRSYMVSVWVRPTVNIGIDSCIAVYTRLVEETGVGFVFTAPSAVANNFESTGYGLNPATNKRTGAIPANTWVKMEGRIGVPADATNTFIIPGMYLQSSFPTGSSCDFSNLNISEMVTGELIVEGSITTDKLKADAIDGMTITGALIQTDTAAETGVKLDATGIHAWGPEAKTLSITGGRGVDYIGITGYPTTERDADGNPTAFGDLQEVSNIDNTGAIMGQELSIAGTTSLAGTVVMGSEAFHPNAYGLESPGDLGPVILGRSLIGTGFQGFVEDHPRVTTQTSWMDTIPFGVVVNTAREDLGLSWDARGGIAHTRNRLGAWFEFEKNRMYSMSYRTPGTTISGSGTGGATSLRYGGVNQNIGAGEGSQVYGSRNYLPAGEITQTSATTYIRCPEDIAEGRRLVVIEQYIYAGRTATTVSTPDSARWELVIADMGLNRPTFNGTPLYSSIQGDPDPVKPPVVVAPPPPPVAPIKQYIKTWDASWWATYWVGNGNGINSGMKSPKVAQGKPPGVGYLQRGAIGFPSMTGTLSGSTIKKVEVYVYAAHWYSSAGGTLEIGTHGHTSKPTTMSEDLVTNRKSQSLKKPEGRWVTLPSTVHAGVLSGSVRGIQAYTTSTSLSKYGYLDGKRTKIRVTYAK